MTPTKNLQGHNLKFIIADFAMAKANKRTLPVHPRRDSGKKQKTNHTKLKSTCRYVARILSKPASMWQYYSSPLNLPCQIDKEYTETIVALPMSKETITEWDPGNERSWKPPVPQMNQGVYQTMVFTIRPVYDAEQRAEARAIKVNFGATKNRTAPWKDVLSTWKILATIYSIVWYHHPYLTREEAFKRGTTFAKTELNKLDKPSTTQAERVASKLVEIRTKQCNALLNAVKDSLALPQSTLRQFKSVRNAQAAMKTFLKDREITIPTGTTDVLPLFQQILARDDKASDYEREIYKAYGSFAKAAEVKAAEDAERIRQLFLYFQKQVCLIKLKHRLFLPTLRRMRKARLHLLRYYTDKHRPIWKEQIGLQKERIEKRDAIKDLFNEQVDARLDDFVDEGLARKHKSTAWKSLERMYSMQITNDNLQIAEDAVSNFLVALEINEKCQQVFYECIQSAGVNETRKHMERDFHQVIQTVNILQEGGKQVAPGFADFNCTPTFSPSTLKAAALLGMIKYTEGEHENQILEWLPKHMVPLFNPYMDAFWWWITDKNREKAMPVLEKHIQAHKQGNHRLQRIIDLGSKVSTTMNDAQSKAKDHWKQYKATNKS